MIAPDVFFKYNSNFKKIMQRDRVVLYERTQDNIITYEVMVMQYKSVMNKPKVWIFPSTSDWGRFGWTLSTYERAVEKYDDICEKYS